MTSYDIDIFQHFLDKMLEDDKSVKNPSLGPRTGTKKVESCKKILKEKLLQK